MPAAGLGEEHVLRELRELRSAAAADAAERSSLRDVIAAQHEALSLLREQNGLILREMQSLRAEVNTLSNVMASPLRSP